MTEVKKPNAIGNTEDKNTSSTTKSSTSKEVESVQTEQKSSALKNNNGLNNNSHQKDTKENNDHNSLNNEKQTESDDKINDTSQDEAAGTDSSSLAAQNHAISDEELGKSSSAQDKEEKLPQTGNRSQILMTIAGLVIISLLGAIKLLKQLYVHEK